MSLIKSISGIRVVAASGTALTEIHASILARYAKTAYLVFDGDAAGRKATNESFWFVTMITSDRLSVAVASVKVISVVVTVVPLGCVSVTTADI